jgi:RNA polymerase sigma-70 factor (ECF subfamily)
VLRVGVWPVTHPGVATSLLYGPTRPEAFRALYHEHRPTIRRYFVTRATPDQVEDLLSETFLVAWRRAGEGKAHTLPWLLNVAAKVLANDRRKAESTTELVRRLTQVTRFETPSVAIEAERRAEHLAVLHALAQLRPRDRELLLLSVWDGLSTGEVAVVLGITPIAARARLSRARRRLESGLRSELEVPSPRTSPTFSEGTSA